MTLVNKDNWQKKEFRAACKPGLTTKSQPDPAQPPITDLHEVLHDANQPLSVIIGLAELGLYSSADEAVQADFNTILEEAHKLQSTLIKARDIVLEHSDNYAAG